MMKKGNAAGHLAIAAAYIIFGVNIVTTKDIANSHDFAPTLLFTLRAFGASGLFWLLSLFARKRDENGRAVRDNVPLKDLGRIFCASMLGLFVPQMTFLFAITMATPIDTAVFSTLGPIFTMFFAYFFVKEPITLRKAGGVALSFIGIIFLILNSVHSGGAQATSPLGIILLLLNSVSFSLYLGIFRPLIQKYRVVTFMKWSFLFSLLASLPFSIGQFPHTDFAAVAPKIWAETGFLIFFATFVAYFLIPFGQKSVRPTIVALYNYLQPIFASVIGVVSGLDSISWQKVVAILLVFTGVFFVNGSKAAPHNEIKK